MVPERCLPLAGSGAPSLPPLPSSAQRSGISEPGPSIANDAQPAPSNITGGQSQSGFQSARSFGGAVASASTAGGLGSRRGPAGRRFSLPFSQGVSITAAYRYAAQHRHHRVTYKHRTPLQAAKSGHGSIQFRVKTFCCTSQAPFSGVSGISEDFENENFIWGTTIRAHHITRELEQFFETFTEEGADEPKYIRLLREVGCAVHMNHLELAEKMTLVIHDEPMMTPLRDLCNEKHC